MLYLAVWMNGLELVQVENVTANVEGFLEMEMDGEDATNVVIAEKGCSTIVMMENRFYTDADVKRQALEILNIPDEIKGE